MPREVLMFIAHSMLDVLALLVFLSVAGSFPRIGGGRLR